MKDIRVDYLCCHGLPSFFSLEAILAGSVLLPVLALDLKLEVIEGGQCKDSRCTRRDNGIFSLTSQMMDKSRLLASMLSLWAAIYIIYLFRLASSASSLLAASMACHLLVWLVWPILFEEKGVHLSKQVCIVLDSRIELV